MAGEGDLRQVKKLKEEGNDPHRKITAPSD